MKNTLKFKDYLKQQLKKEGVRKAFDEEDVYVSLAIQIARIRQKENLSQRQLSQKLHTTQQTVSRLEDTHNRSFSLKTLIKLAQVLHKRLRVEFV